MGNIEGQCFLGLDTVYQWLSPERMSQLCGSGQLEGPFEKGCLFPLSLKSFQHFPALLILVCLSLTCVFWLYVLVCLLYSCFTFVIGP